jgi:hypothetical protein
MAAIVNKNIYIYFFNYDSGQVWFKLAQWFQRRRFLKKFTDGRHVMAIAHTGELKTLLGNFFTNFQV